MKITVFIGGLTGGGAERVVCNLSNYLCENNDVTLLTMSETATACELDGRIKRQSLLHKGEEKNYLLNNAKRWFRLRKFVKSYSADAYVVMLPDTINLLLMCRTLTSAPIVVSERCDPNTWFDSSFSRKYLMKHLYPKADGFVFQTEDAQKYYDGIITSNSVVIPNAINPEFVQEQYCGERKKTIVSVGRLTEQKNFSMLISAFAKISDKNKNHSLVIYGEGPQLEMLQQLAASFGISDRVIFPGYVNNIVDLVNDAGIFVLASNYEGMPNVLMEAMALGLPCISTDCPVGGPRFLIKDGENGLLLPVGNVEALAEAMDRVLSDVNLAKKLGKNARKIVDELNADKIYGQWEEFITSFAKR